MLLARTHGLWAAASCPAVSALLALMACRLEGGPGQQERAWRLGIRRQDYVQVIWAHFPFLSYEKDRVMFSGLCTSQIFLVKIR